MWWDESERRWRRHPDCECERDPCVCPWLDPLDRNGKPIKGTIIEDIRKAITKESVQQ